MNHMISKAALIALSAAYAYGNDIDARFVAALLLSVIMCSLWPAVYDRCRKEKASAHAILETVFCVYYVIGLFLPIHLFSAVANYDIYRYRQKAAGCFLAAQTVYVFYSMPAKTSMTYLCTTAAAFVLSYVNCKNDLLEGKLITIHDDSVEHDMLAAENTRRILENQDNRILTATLTERNRIAREIHDNVGHMLTRSILQTGAIKVLNKDDALTEPLDNLQSTLDTAMTGMRTSVHDLKDESVNLRLALADMADDMNRSTENFDISLDYDMGDVIPRDVKYSFINIAKEAVNNAIKHSSGSRVCIAVREHPAFYRLAVSDNGHVAKTPAFGMGLTNIKERVNMLGGNMNISVRDGFALIVTVGKATR